MRIIGRDEKVFTAPKRLDVHSRVDGYTWQHMDQEQREEYVKYTRHNMVQMLVREALKQEAIVFRDSWPGTGAYDWFLQFDAYLEVGSPHTITVANGLFLPMTFWERLKWVVFG